MTATQSHQSLLETCIEACFDCLRDCENCATACLDSDMVQMMLSALNFAATVRISATFAPGLWHAILTFTLNCAGCVQKPAITVPLSVSSMIMSTASGVLSLVVAVPNPAVRWWQQWHSDRNEEVLQVNAVWLADALTNQTIQRFATIGSLFLYSP
jgi:hypothetical protein